MPKKKNTAPLTFRLVEYGEREKLLDFINANFDWRLPLVNRREFFEHYYCGDRLQFAVAECEGQWQAAAGYILANRSETPDLWVSVWVAVKGANGAGLELMNALPALTGARVVACNNIRENTCVFYRFLGWEAERLAHYYRLADRGSAEDFKLCRPASCERLPVGGDLTLDKVSTTVRLAGLGMPPSSHTPQKDLWYITRRYFAFPHLSYDVWSISEKGRLLAYLVTRTVASGEQGEIPVLRIVDYIGEDAVLPRIGAAVDKLLAKTGAEYADCYCAGIPAEVFAAMGFTERKPGDGAIIPNYLTPPLYDNTEYFYFTSKPEGFVMFKADGDQDRPNLPCDD